MGADGIVLNVLIITKGTFEINKNIKKFTINKLFYIFYMFFIFIFIFLYFYIFIFLYFGLVQPFLKVVLKVGFGSTFFQKVVLKVVLKVGFGSTFFKGWLEIHRRWIRRRMRAIRLFVY